MTVASPQIRSSCGLEMTAALWIWPANTSGLPNQYVDFRQEVSVDTPAADAELLISADSNYALWINDVFVDSGQYSDFPERKTYDRLSVGQYLQRGPNVLLITVYYQGVDSFQYAKGEPGVIFALRSGHQSFTSGTATQCRRSPGYRVGPAARVTRQLGFSFEYDARDPGGQWKAVQGADLCGHAGTRGLSPRPVRKLTLQPRPATMICAQGTFRRSAATSALEGVGPVMQQDALLSRSACEILGSDPPLTLPSSGGAQVVREVLGEGIYFVIDLEREEAGILELEVDADAGTCIDVGYGEHLDDLRVRTAVGGRNFANRYICRDGRQTFIHRFSRIAGRYLQLNVSGTRRRFTLHYAGLRPTEYPVQREGEFLCPDSLSTRIFQTGVRTLHMCMHEHYEDTPWREQALYAFDSRNQALCGYHCFGDYQFPAASFALLAQSLGDDGYQQMCAPANIDHTIPSFSFAWVLAVADHWLYSGDTAFVRGVWPSLQRMMRIHLSRMCDGLLPCPAGQRYWQFYDWAPGLDGRGRLLDAYQKRFDAPLNLLFCLALQGAGNVADAVGDADSALELRAAAQRLRPCIAAAFWDERGGAYQTYIGCSATRHFAELTQSLAILAGVAAPNVADRLRYRLTQPENGLVATTLSHSLYKFESLLTDAPNHGHWVFDAIARDWGGMLLRGATSFWETIKGADDFDGAGSLCHGWSAIPVYFYSAYLLGIRPVEPGFRRFKLSPVAGIVSCASGKVPTPFGPIRVSWTHGGDGFEYHRFSHPGETQPAA